MRALLAVAPVDREHRHLLPHPTSKSCTGKVDNVEITDSTIDILVAGVGIGFGFGLLSAVENMEVAEKAMLTIRSIRSLGGSDGQNRIQGEHAGTIQR